MKSSFQTILLIAFVGAFVFAVAVFSGIFSSGKKTATTPHGAVIIWGVLPEETVQPYIANFNSQGIGYSLVYVEQNPTTFVSELTSAIADSVAPDMVLVNSEIFSKMKSKLFTIPYSVLSERTYRDTYVDGAQLFLNNEGSWGIPLLVDPLVVYYNKDLLAKERFALPPHTWSDLTAAVPLFTARDARGNLTQTALAMGEYQNIGHFRDILSALFLQVGNAIVYTDRERGTQDAVLDEGAVSATGEPATVSALQFFTSFSDPANTLYTWNRALPESLEMFVSGRSAFYIGKASELFSIQAKNPNLNFDVIELFQPDTEVRPITYGSFTAAALLKNAPNFTTAYAYVASLSADPSASDQLSKALSLPPVRRDLLLVQQSNPYIGVFFKAALSSFAWPDPDPVATDTIFRDMIQNVKSGRLDIDSSINEANASLQSNIR